MLNTSVSVTGQDGVGHRESRRMTVLEGFHSVRFLYDSHNLTFWFPLGNAVAGDKERDHYKSVCGTPRQVFSMWHTLG